MICQNCGATVNDGTMFCQNCGAQVSAPQQPVYQQPAYQQPAYQQPAYGAKVKVPGKGFGISALVLGIVGLVYSFIALAAANTLSELGNLANGLSYGAYSSSGMDSAVVGEFISGILVWAVMSLLATVFGFVSRKRGYVNGVSMSGLVMGIIGLAVYLISIFIAASV